jgi:hypothetical protein
MSKLRTGLPVLRLARLLPDVAGAGVLGATVLSGLIALLLVRILAFAHEISPELALRLSSLSPKSLAGMTNSKHNEKASP